MGTKLFKSGYIRVEPNHEINLEPITLEDENRGAIHGTVKGVDGKVCIVKLFKIKGHEIKGNNMTPIAFQYLDNWGQFLFPITDTNINTLYIIKVFCLDQDECTVDPIIGNCHYHVDC